MTDITLRVLLAGDDLALAAATELGRWETFGHVHTTRLDDTDPDRPRLELTVRVRSRRSEIAVGGAAARRRQHVQIVDRRPAAA